MSFNGSGTFVINSANQPVVASTLITASVFNALTADLATGLSTCIAKDGQSTVTANIPMSTYKITGLGAATASTDAASLANIQAGTGVYVGTVGGTADVITLTASPAIAAYAAGQTFRFIASGANTTNVTVQINGLASPKAITKNGATALVANDILSGMMVQITYDGTRFILGTHLTADVVTLAGTQTLTNKTLTAPVLGGTVTGTYTLGGTPTIADNVFTISGSADATKKVAFEVDGLTTATTRTLTVQDADQTLVGRATTDTLTNKTVDLTSNTLTGTLAQFNTACSDADFAAITLETPQATTSGTAFDFNSLPTGIKRITIMFSQVSLSGSDNWLVQIGDAGGLETTVYDSLSLTTNSSGSTATTSTSAFIIRGGDAATAITGHMTLTLANSSTNLWVSSHILQYNASSSYVTGGGDKALSATLDRVRLTRSGANTFDAGAVNIQYER